MSVKMYSCGFSALGAGVVALLLLGTTGCSSENQPGGAATLATDAANSNGDPSNGNLAPAGEAAPVDQTSSSQSTAVQYQNPAPPPPQYSAQPATQDTTAYQESAYQEELDAQASDQQTIYANDAPPALPEYSQPSCPGENYIWTPGTWSYASNGYYWVPGAWILAPYVGALWTPPYWEFYERRFRWHRGYWGAHIGFYGGIDYGFGYVGRGYYGGYWHGDHFAYNSVVNNVNVNLVQRTNVYNYHVRNATNSRASYNGGPGGVALRPTAPEMAAIHEQRMAPVAAQVDHMNRAAGNRAQFAAVNQGRPAQAAIERPLAANYRAPALRPNEVPGHPTMLAPVRSAGLRPGAEPQQARQQPQLARPEPQQARQQPQQARPEPQQQARPQPQQARPEPQQQARPQPQQARPELQQQPRPQPQQQPRPQPQQTRPEPQQQARPQPQQARPEPQQQSRPQPQQARPEPQQQPRPQPQQTRPGLQQQPRPQPQQTRPEPQQQARPQPQQARPEPPQQPRPQPQQARQAPAPHAEPARPEKKP